MRSVRKIQVATTLDSSDWTVLGNDTTGLVDVDFGVSRAKTLRFNKADGAANTKLAAVYRTIDIPTHELPPEELIVWGIYCSALTAVDYAFVRIGVDAANYCEYQYADSSMAVGWSLCRKLIGEASSVVGRGLSSAKVATYFVAGVAFDAETSTLASIGFSGAFTALTDFSS